MSYILEALKKSDQQRQRGAAPTLLTTQAMTEAPKQRAFLFYAVLAAVLIGAGITIGWLHPWQPEQPVSATEQVAATQHESKPRQAASAPLPALPVTTEKPVRQATPTMQPALAKIETLGAPPKAVMATPREMPAPMPEQPVSIAPANSAQEQKVMRLSELPVSVQQEIPKMAISVHVYSNKPKDRLVSINDRILREGDNLSSGLKLEQITPDDIIFSYKGYRFRRSVQ